MGSLRSYGLSIIFVLNLSSCNCEAGYEIFPGFDPKNETEPTVGTVDNTVTSSTNPSTTAKAPDERSEDKIPITTAKSTVTKMATTEDPLFSKSFYKPYVCPEEEKPLNIGPYEVPTQKDLVVHMKKTLLRMFKRYHRKALFFLNDITEATKATTVVENSCPTLSKSAYRMCVRHVSNQCQVITKSLVTSLERQRHDVSAFTAGSICNVSSMQADPVQLIKTIAMEHASLEFALPGFLRLLGACSVYCQRTAYWQKATRHKIDQDLLIKHFMTRKIYAQLIKGPIK